MEVLSTLALTLGAFLLLMFAGFPISFSFLAVMLGCSLILMGPVSGWSFFLGSVFDSLTTFTLTPIPMFIMMGSILFHSGIAMRSVDALSKCLGSIPGRLSILANLTGGLLGLLSGSTLGTTALLGTLLAPEMRERGYSKTMTYGPILAAGGLAMVIPPSNLTVIYATIAHISVGKLLVSGLVPGLMMMSFYIIIIVARTLLNPSLAPRYEVARSPLGEVLRALLIDVFPLGLIIFLVTGFIVIGVATPTEAAATGAAGAFLLAALYRRLKWETVVKTMQETVKITVMVFMIVAGSITYSQILAYSGISRVITENILALTVSPSLTLLVMMIVILLLGTLMDQVAIIMITVPIFTPIVAALGIDPFLFGILMLINLEIALTTPPFGMLLFVMKGVATEDVSMGDLYRSAFPFILSDMTVMLTIFFFPSIALWLPSLS